MPDADVGERLRRLRAHGAPGVHVAAPGPGFAHPSHREVGWNGRMSDVLAAIARVQLGRLPLLLHRRRHLADRYRELLGDAGLLTTADPSHATTTYQSFCVQLPDGAPAAADLARTLLAHGITARAGVVAAHLQPVYAGQAGLPLPVTERLARSTITLPLFHDLEVDDLERIVDVVVDAVGPLAEVG